MGKIPDFLSILIIAALGGLWCASAHAAAVDVVGTAAVIDGDTIELSGERIRLHGIDAPESDQSCQIGAAAWPCGGQATLALRREMDGHTVTCRGGKRDRYGRLIAVCFVGDVNINAKLVRDGWALAYRQYSLEYVAQEMEARAAGRGLWRGQFTEPWEWRHRLRAYQ
jgi:endonuclease YncB( thermonuclease family)